MHEDTPQPRYRERFPLFPLHTVLLPGVHLPLHVFEPRYRQLVVDLITGELDDSDFGVVAIRNAMINDVDQVGQLHEIGCTAMLREAERLDGGQFDIVATGTRRFRLLEIVDDPAPYLVGTVEWLDDQPSLDPSGTTANALSAAARAAHERYCELAWSDDDWSPPSDDVAVDQLAYLLAEDCLLPLADRQAVLAETDPMSRLRMVNRLLSREAGFLCALSAVPAPHNELKELSAQAKLN